MPTYAAETTVTPIQSRAEIERTLERFGASGFGYGYDGGQAVVTFRKDNRIVRFVVRVPDESEFLMTSGRYPKRRTAVQVKAAAGKAERQRWRALALLVKAKLEAVEAGIETFEEAFMAHIVLPDGSTVGEFLGPQIEQAYESGDMPSLLPGTQRQLDP